MSPAPTPHPDPPPQGGSEKPGRAKSPVRSGRAPSPHLVPAAAGALSITVLPVNSSSLSPPLATASSAGGEGGAGGRSGKRSSVSNCAGSIGFSDRWRCASAWMRAGLSSLPHSARSMERWYRARRRISVRIFATRSACTVEFELDLVDIGRRGDEEAHTTMRWSHRIPVIPPQHVGERRQARPGASRPRASRVPLRIGERASCPRLGVRPLCRAQFGGTGARIVLDLGFIRRNRAAGEDVERRRCCHGVRQVTRGAGGTAAFG